MNQKLTQQFRFSLVLFSLFTILYCSLTFADDLRDLLLPRDLFITQNLIPFPLDLEIGQISEKKRKIDRIFSLRNQIDYFHQFSKYQLEQAVEYKDFVTRQLLLEIDEQHLSTLKIVLKTSRAPLIVDMNRAYSAALIAKQLQQERLLYVAGYAAANTLTLQRTLTSQEQVQAFNAAWNAAQTSTWGAANKSMIRLSNIIRPYCSDTQQNAKKELEEASRKTIMETLTRLLPVLDETEPTLLAQKAYALSELISLNWLINNGAAFYENLFLTTYDFLSEPMEINSTKERLKSYIENPKTKNNPFIIELDFFLRKVDKRLRKFDAVP